MGFLHDATGTVREEDRGPGAQSPTSLYRGEIFLGLPQRGPAGDGGRLRQTKAKRIRAQQNQDPERTPKWWQDPVIMGFLMAVIIAGMVFYITLVKPDLIVMAIDLIVQTMQAYSRWVK